MQEENIVSQQNLSSSTDVRTNEKKKIKTSVKVVLAIMWIVYLPVAFFIFAMSGMAGDSPYTPEWQILSGMALINGVPLLLVVALTFFLIRKNSVKMLLWSIFGLWILGWLFSLLAWSLK